MFRHYLPHFIFFAAFFSAALPVLFYVRRKNPDPRFRPNAGEMALFTLIAVFICGGMAVGLGSLFKPENDGKSLTKKPSEGAGWSASGAGPAGSSKGKEKKEKSGDDPPKRSLHDRL